MAPTTCLAMSVSSVYGRCKIITVKAGTSGNTARLPCLAHLPDLALLPFCARYQRFCFDKVILAK